MATYKLIQDIEAEDHILGPLTLRQFIYGLIAAFFYYICFVVTTKHVPILLVLFLPVALFTSFFAFPFGRDQPTEVWALAKIRFFIKPRKRIWSQSGIKNLVTITAPKKTDRVLTKNLTATEVQNRLETLALMIDTRGWAVKNMAQVPDNINISYHSDASDRLISPGSIPIPVPDYDVTREEDIFDDVSPQSMHAADAITQSTKKRRQQLMATLGTLRQPDQSSTQLDPVSEAAVAKTLKANAADKNLSTSRLHRIDNNQISNVEVTPKVEQQQPNPSHINPAILSFALNNNGLSIQSLADEAKTASSNDEVVINLH